MHTMLPPDAMGVGRLRRLYFGSPELLPRIVALLRQQLVLTALIESCVSVNMVPGQGRNGREAGK